MVEVIVIGAGGHGKVVIDAILSNPESNIKLIGFLDDGDIEEIAGIKKLGNISGWKRYQDKRFHIAIGNNEFRERLARELGEERLVTVVHKTAYVSSMSEIGVGSYIGAMAVINPETKVGKACIVNTGSIVEHNCEIEDYVHLSYKVLVGSESRISTKVMIDMGRVLERKSSI